MPKAQATMRSEATTLLADNNSRNISPQDTRDRITDVIDWLDTLGSDVNVPTASQLTTLDAGDVFTGMLVRAVDTDVVYYLKATPHTTLTNWVDLSSGGSLLLADGEMYVGNVSGVATGVTISGDMLTDNTGAFTAQPELISDKPAETIVSSLADEVLFLQGGVLKRATVADVVTSVQTTSIFIQHADGTVSEIATGTTEASARAAFASAVAALVDDDVISLPPVKFVLPKTVITENRIQFEANWAYFKGQFDGTTAGDTEYVLRFEGNDVTVNHIKMDTLNATVGGKGRGIMAVGDRFALDGLKFMGGGTASTDGNPIYTSGDNVRISNVNTIGQRNSIRHDGGDITYESCVAYDYQFNHAFTFNGNGPASDGASLTYSKCQAICLDTISQNGGFININGFEGTAGRGSEVNVENCYYSRPNPANTVGELVFKIGDMKSFTVSGTDIEVGTHTTKINLVAFSTSGMTSPEYSVEHCVFRDSTLKGTITHTGATGTKMRSMEIRNCNIDFADEGGQWLQNIEVENLEVRNSHWTGANNLTIFFNFDAPPQDVIIKGSSFASTAATAGLLNSAALGSLNNYEFADVVFTNTQYVFGSALTSGVMNDKKDNTNNFWTMTGTTPPDVPNFGSLDPGSYAINEDGVNPSYTWDGSAWVTFPIGTSLPAGGAISDQLYKKSATNFDATWQKSMVRPQHYGAVADGATDDSAALDAAAAAAEDGILFIPSGTYAIDPQAFTDATISQDYGFRIRSNTTVIFEENAVITALNTADTNQSAVMAVWNASNVVIKGGKLAGDQATHTGGTHEVGRALDIRGATDVDVQHMELTEAMGHGIFVSDYNGTGCSRIATRRIRSHANREHACLIEHCDGFSDEASHFQDSLGATLESGVVVQPTSPQVVSGVRLNFSTATGNNRSGVYFDGIAGVVKDCIATGCVMGSNLGAGGEMIHTDNCWFNDCSSVGNLEGFQLDGCINSGVKGGIAESNTDNGVQIRDESINAWRSADNVVSGVSILRNGGNGIFANSASNLATGLYLGRNTIALNHFIGLDYQGAECVAEDNTFISNGQDAYNSQDHIVINPASTGIKLRRNKILKANPARNFTAAAPSTLTSVDHKLKDDDRIRLYTTGTLPSGLLLATTYYLVSVTDDTFQLSLTSGGSAVTFTGTGTGTHSWQNLYTRRGFDIQSGSSGAQIFNNDLRSAGETEIANQAATNSLWKANLTDTGYRGTIASAGVTNLATVIGDVVEITGTLGITSFGNTEVGAEKRVRFLDALVLTHHATDFILPTAANITTAANDTLKAVSLGASKWHIVDYMRADGSPLNGLAELIADTSPQLGGNLDANGKQINESFDTIAAATTTDLATVNGNYIAVTSAATINSFGTVPAGTEMQLTFAGVNTITDSSSINCITGANITTAAGDTCLLRSDGAGVWTMTHYQRFDGSPLIGTIPVTQGGTGLQTLTDGGIVLGSGTGAVTVTPQPTNGQVLIGSTGADPILATLTGVASEINVSNGPGTITIGFAVVPIGVSKGGTGATTFTSGGIIYGTGTAALRATAQPTNGQILIGSTGADPILGTITGTANQIGVANGPGAITVSIISSPTLPGTTTLAPSLSAPLLANGQQIQESSTTQASASVDLATAAGNYVSISGTTTITAFGTVPAGTEFTLAFEDALILTHNATSLICPTGANITTAAGDSCEIRSLGAGNWRITDYTRAAGGSLYQTTPQQFGAKGDGTTDDTAAFQAALDSGVPFILTPKGTYLVDNLTISTANQKIVGEGWDSIIKKRTAAAEILQFVKISASGVVMEDIAVDASQDAAFGIEIIANNTDCKILRTKVFDCRHTTALCAGIRFRDGCHNTVIDHCHVENVHSAGAAVAARGIHYEGATAPTVPLKGARVTHNRVTIIKTDQAGGQDADGIVFASTTAESDFLIHGNIIDQCTHRGIKTNSMPGAVVTSNVIRFTAFDSFVRCSYGISVQGSNSVCNDNKIIGAFSNGITTAGAEYNHITISGNEIMIENWAATSGVDIQSFGTGYSITGNTIVGGKEWQPSTVYAVGDIRTGNSYITGGTASDVLYECTQAGTSGATGPTGTGINLQDGGGAGGVLWQSCDNTSGFPNENASRFGIRITGSGSRDFTITGNAVTVWRNEGVSITSGLATPPDNLVIVGNTFRVRDRAVQGDDATRGIVAYNMLKGGFNQGFVFPNALIMGNFGHRSGIAGTDYFAKIASNASTPLNLIEFGDLAVHITGTTTIAGFATGSAGRVVLTRFESAGLTLTHSTSFSLPGNQDIITKAGDYAWWIQQENKTDWECIAYFREDGTPIVNGSIAFHTTTSTPYTAGTNNEDFVLVDTDTIGGAATVTLPAIASYLQGRKLSVKKKGTGGNVTIDGNGSETIDGAATQTIITQDDVVDLAHNGTEWVVI